MELGIRLEVVFLLVCVKYFEVKEHFLRFRNVASATVCIM